jgi:hypothetical protein
VGGPGAPPGAQLPGVGLSSVGGQAFANENLLFYAPAPGDNFGAVVVAGDFSGDGIDDLATGIPADSGFVNDPLLGCGAVVVRYGAPGARLETGLADTYLNQFASGTPDPAEFSEYFGSALAAGDFDGDGIDDLAIGIPQNGAGVSHSGAVQIHYGRAGGIQLAGEHFLRLGTNGIPGTPVQSDRFGLALAAGNFNGDAYADLAVGIPNGDLPGPLGDAGKVLVFHGGAAGLLPFSGYFVSQAEAQMEGVAEAGDAFGYSLVAGDFDGSGQDDLAIGVPHEDGLGAVQVVLGGPSGLVLANNRLYLRSTLGQSVADSRFGWTLAAGDFNGDGRDDLVVGDPYLDFTISTALRQDVGAIHVLYVSDALPPSPWFDLDHTDFLHQGIFYGNAAQQEGDNFGSALAAGDFDGDGDDDLAIGQPGEDLGGDGRGGVTVVTGEPIGGLPGYFRFLSPGSSGLPGSSQNGQSIGMALAAGDFDDNGHLDLVLGAPYSDVAGIGADVGAEFVLYGALFADGFDGNSAIYWSATLP